MKKDKKSVIALLGIALLVLLYVATLVTAFLNIPNWDRLFQACIVATIGLPILLWIYLLILKDWKNRQERSREDTDNE